jgi:hypothetical protein
MLRFTVVIAAALSFAGLSGAAEAPPRLEDTNPQEALAEVRTIAVRADKLGSLLQRAGWVHKGDGGLVLYDVGFRSCPDCVVQRLAAFPVLEAAGIDIRSILYARPDSAEGKPRSKPGERAMVAELWKSRDYALYERWYETDPATFYETEELPPSADDNGERAALVERSRAFVGALRGILKDNGLDLYVPALFWQEDGQWMVYIGYNRETFDRLVVKRLTGG